MAKRRSTANTRSPTDEDFALACHAIRSMYGHGIDTAAEKVRRYAPEVITAMANEERAGRRDRIPAMLANCKMQPAHE